MSDRHRELIEIMRAHGGWPTRTSCPQCQHNTCGTWAVAWGEYERTRPRTTLAVEPAGAVG